jgi:hypothetical protein
MAPMVAAPAGAIFPEIGWFVAPAQMKKRQREVRSGCANGVDRTRVVLTSPHRGPLTGG